MNNNIFIIGFMLFALFFGAGNLIYPPILGIQSGTSYWGAISGFLITGVGLPILAVMAISFVKNDARELANVVHPIFGLIFTSMVYLAIGPFFGIPRAATVAYEMSIAPFTEVSPVALFIFTIIFFALVYIVSRNPNKIVDLIGQILTPVLFVAILGLIAGALFLLKGPSTAPVDGYVSAPFFTGFIEGYLTMDAIGALAFGIVVVNAFKDRGVTSQKDLVKATGKAGVITAVGLIIVYTSLGWIGSKMATHGDYSNGGEILSAAADYMFGGFGSLLLGIIVALACFTTCVGLVVAAAQFFEKLTPFSYKSVVLIITLGSFLISNQGLETIINYSVPVLVFIYPIAIVLIILPFFSKLIPQRQAFYRGAIVLTFFVSLYDGLIEFGLEMPNVTAFMEKIPLLNIGLGWLISAIIGGVLGILIGQFSSKSTNANDGAS